MTCTISTFTTFSIKELAPGEVKALYDELRDKFKSHLKKVVDEPDSGQLYFEVAGELAKQVKQLLKKKKCRFTSPD